MRIHATLFTLAIMACDRPAERRTESGASASAPAHWFEIARTPDIVALLDTSRIERLGEGHAKVWYRFVYTHPIRLGSDTTQYAAAEAREELDCLTRRTRDVAVRMETVAGVSAASPTPDVGWIAFDKHPLNSGVFFVGCRAIGHPLAPRPGA
jgi:hypothetical protein